MTTKKTFTTQDAEVPWEAADPDLRKMYDQIENDMRVVKRAAAKNDAAQLAAIVNDSVLPILQQLIETMIVRVAVLQEDVGQAREAAEGADDDLRLDADDAELLEAVLGGCKPLVETLLASPGLQTNAEETAKLRTLLGGIDRLQGIVGAYFEGDEEVEGDEAPPPLLPSPQN